MTLVKVQNLKKYYPIKGGIFGNITGSIKAVDDVSFEIESGQTLGLVGESGCGKSTVGRTLLNLSPPTSGEVYFEGKNIFRLSSRDMRQARRQMQIIFQDPFDSLNQRHTIEEILEEPFVIHRVGNRRERMASVRKLMDLVGLPQSFLSRFPHEFSGGQRQRIGIARAVSLGPKLIVCDEPVSALDVSVQSQIMNLLCDLQRELSLSYLFIAHGLTAVKHMSDSVAVMYLGKIVEMAPTENIYRSPMHPYTQALFSSIPDPQKKRVRVPIIGEIPSARNPPAGCRFHTRCPLAQDVCRSQEPQLKAWKPGHKVACHLVV